MKFCDKHWQELKAAIAARGLEHLVSSSGAECAARMQGGDFEPLMGAMLSYVRNAVGVMGPVVLMPNDDGSDRCAACFLAGCPCEQKPCPFASWIDRAADDELTEARRRGLVPEAS